MRMPRIVPLVVIAGLAVGCTSGGGAHHSTSASGPSPSATSSSPSSTSPAPSPTPTTTAPSVATTGPNVRPGEKPPTLPALAKHHTDVGAVQFAEYWWQSLDWAYATTDSALPKSLFLPQCSDCIRFMKIYDGAQAKGEHYIGSRISVHSARLALDDHRHPGSTPVDVVITAGKLETVNASGEVIDRAPATPKSTYRLWLEWSGGRWAVLDSKQVVFKK